MDRCQCGKEKNEKYAICLDCNNKAKQGDSVEELKQINKNLSAINNNLYHIIRQNKVTLRKMFGVKIVWDKDKKDFVETGVEDA